MGHLHPFHLVKNSPWPLRLSMSLLLTAFSFLGSLSSLPLFFTTLSCLYSFSVLCLWQLDIIIESTYEGSHTFRVRYGLTLGWLLFLCSEVIFFFSFFWAYFHFALSPDPAIGGSWPPAGLSSLNAFTLPLLNTVFLLSSSCTVTWSHHCLLSELYSTRLIGLLVTIFFAVAFLCCQVLEYHLCSFTIADSCYGSIFFVATGFHGFHVLVGTLLLSACLLRFGLGHFSSTRHLGLLFSIWYWHFVDVIWVLLFLIFYVWGG